MLFNCHWIVLYTVHFTAFCLGSRFFPGHGVVSPSKQCMPVLWEICPSARRIHYSAPKHIATIQETDISLRKYTYCENTITPIYM